MRILYLVRKEIYQKKMSRVRFHSIDAIKRYPGVTLKKSGPGWGDFDIKTVEKDFKPDLVIWYKPLQIKGYETIKAPKCLRYNEMWNCKWTKKEIEKSNSKLVICHHLNDIERFKGKLDPDKYKLVHNPHCAETEIFKHYEQPKKIDVLLTGYPNPKSCYPLRWKLFYKVKPMLEAKGIKVEIFKHPGYKLPGLQKIEQHTKKYAKALNSAKIVATCASDFHYALAKYSEIPMCHTALCGDIPKENQEWYRKWMIEIKQSHGAKEIRDKIIKYLKDKEKLKHITSVGYHENLDKRKQEDYARRFLDVADDFLSGKMQDYDFGTDADRYYNGKEGNYLYH